MGNQANVKQIRGQIRQIVAEILPELLAGELINKIDSKLTKQVTAKLELVTKNVDDTMKRIDERAKDVQDYLARQIVQGPVQPATSPVLEPKKE